MDFTKLTVFQTLAAKMTWLNERQRVLAQNVANADTPGYEARDIKEPDFARMLDRLQRRPGKDVAPVQIARTDGQHLSGGGGGTALGGEVALDPKKVDGLEPSPTGNAVNLEEEMMKVARSAADYELMANLYQRQLGMLRLALGKPGRR
jgi:flagellar basal-body rod protein FlgB